MNQLDKWNKELERLSKKSYKNMDKELYNFYKDTLKKLKIEIKNYIEEYETLSFSERLQAERSIKTANRIDERLKELSENIQLKIEDYIKNEADRGYYGTFYSIEGNAEVQIDFSMLNEDYIEELVNKKVNGKDFSKRLYEHRDKLAKEVTSALLNGAITGKGYRSVAKEIGELTEANYKRALRIARTEGGRVQSTVRQKAYEEARDKGIDLEKKWLATLDKKTRHSHQELDGQTIPIDDKFIFNGNEADGPRLFGEPSLDINCRCTTISIVNGIAPEIRKDNETKEIIDYKSYKDWKKDKVKKYGQKRWNINEKKVKNKSSDINQYNKYKKAIGKKNIPKTLDEFQELIYNNSKEYGILKAQYKGMNYYNKALKSESLVTKKVTAIANKVNMKTVGLEYRIKGKDSYLRKIRSNYSPDGNEYEIKDILRYTYTSPSKSLSEKTLSSINEYNKDGYNINKIKNYWLNKNNPYNGINTVVSSPSGQKFEVQYHTPESFDIKNGEMHKLYEKWRVLPNDSEERINLEKQMKKLSESMEPPKDIERVK